MHGQLETGSVSVATPGRIAAQASIGTVRLAVSDPARSARFYEHVLGLRAADGEDGSIALTAGGQRALVQLYGEASAPQRDPDAPGLFHMAILLPDRAQLAMALARLGTARWPLSGASDHLVSEALYLADPDGNGIELYRDRPRAEWPERDGTIEMATIPLDLNNLLAELGGKPDVDPLAPPDTRMGHVHLQVSDLAEAEAFYAGVLGFDVMVRSYPGALFVSAGGYHHHIGLNTWRSAGRRPTPDALGLRSFEVVLPTAEELEKVLERVAQAGLRAAATSQGSLVHDPFGNGVLLRTP